MAGRLISSVSALAVLISSTLTVPTFAAEPHHETHDSTGMKPHAVPEARNVGCDIHWSYSMEAGPLAWSNLGSEFAACATGTQQSPVNLKSTLRANMANIEANYQPAPLTVLNNGHTIQINLPEGSNLTVGDDVYNLIQFHFHTPAENHIDSYTYPVELHFVHKSGDGRLAVLGVMFDEGPANDEIEKIWSHMPRTQSKAQTIDGVEINPAALVPRNRSYNRFTGSLTTPPCTEGVNWHVLVEPLTMSKDQIARFQALFPMNARPVQPLNNRLVVLDR